MVKTNKTQLILAIGSIISGSLFFIFPDKILNIIFYFIGGLIILFGIVNLILNIRENKGELNQITPLLIFDIAAILLGIVFVSIAWLFVQVFIVIIGIIFILFGLWGYYIALNDQSLSRDTKVLKILSSTLNFIIGVLLIIDVSQTIHVIMYILGSLLIINGLIDIFNFVKHAQEVKKLNEEAKKTAPNEEVAQEVIDVEAKEINN